VRKLGTLRDSIPEDSNETLDAPLLERMLLEWTSISRQYAWYSAQVAMIICLSDCRLNSCRQIKFLSQTYAARSGKRPLNISLAPILKGVTSNVSTKYLRKFHTLISPPLRWVAYADRATPSGHFGTRHKYLGRQLDGAQMRIH
jgi:hypothetical protein